MIPLEYRLRPGVRIEAAGDGSRRVVSVLPLSVLRVNPAAARLLERTRGGVSVGRLAAYSLSRGADPRALRGVPPPGDRSRSVRRRPGTRPSPSITVIVPTRDRAPELADCLSALADLDYPAGQLEVIVVDDGSAEPGSVAEVATAHGAGLVANDRNGGPAFARNRGAEQAVGELLAFIDSDCVADPGWLRALTPYFAWERVGAVGGRTVGYHRASRLDRYEEVSSPLDMGARLCSKG